MSLVDAALQTEISKSVAGLPYSLSLGGSAGNTIRAMARLGCDVGFIGKVGTDKTGDFFIQALENLGIELYFPGKGALGTVRVAHFSRRGTDDGDIPGSCAGVECGRGLSLLFSKVTTVSISKVIWCRITS